MRFCCHISESFCDIGLFKPAQKTDNKIFQRCHNLRSIFGSDLTAIFIKGNIAHIVEAVFDTPVLAVELQKALCRGFLRAEAGNAIDGFFCCLAGFKDGSVSVDTAYLFNMGKFKIVV